VSAPEPLSQALRNEMESLRCKVALILPDADLVRELIELRQYKAAHPLTPAVERERIKPKSVLIRQLEAMCVFHEYADREFARLNRKADAIEAGTFDELADREERERNESIGERAVRWLIKTG
jgi:hypothetical protein